MTISNTLIRYKEGSRRAAFDVCFVLLLYIYQSINQHVHLPVAVCGRLGTDIILLSRKRRRFGCVSIPNVYNIHRF